MKRNVGRVGLVASVVCAAGVMAGVAAAQGPKPTGAPSAVMQEPKGKPVPRRPPAVTFERLASEFAKARVKVGIRHDPKTFNPNGVTASEVTVDLAHPFAPTLAFELTNVTTGGEGAGTPYQFLDVAPTGTAQSSFTLHSVQPAGYYLADCTVASWGGKDFKIEMYNVYTLEQSITMSPPADQHLFVTYHADGVHSERVVISSPNNPSWTVWTCNVHPL